MRYIVLIAVLTLLFLPVLATEPVDVSGAAAEVWLKIPANTDHDLWTWGGTPNYYISYDEDYYYYPYYGGYYYYYPYGTIYIDPYV